MLSLARLLQQPLSRLIAAVCSYIELLLTV